MRIETCDFPDDLLYDSEGFVWARPEAPDRVVVGITAILAAVAGRLTSVRPKTTGVRYDRGKSLGTIESGKYFGPIRAPLTGTLVEVNEAILRRPKLLSEAPYTEGWFARLRPTDFATDRKELHTVQEARTALASQIAALRVRCFAAFPDHEMFEIGTECAAVITKLDELIVRIEVGEVVHLVSDDWTAPSEMENWSRRTGQPVVESRREGNLYHFLVKKTLRDPPA